MLPRLDTLSATPVNRVDRVGVVDSVVDPRQQALSRSLQTMIGKTMQAEVLSRLADGSFVVRVNANAARMQLPAGTQVGSEVALTLVALEPRPTFTLGDATRTSALAYTDAAPHAPEPALPGARPDAAAPLAHPGAGASALRGAYAANLLSQAPFAPADQLPPSDADHQAVALSQAARAIASVLGEALRTPAGSTTLIGKLPLLPGAEIVPAKLAVALHEALGSSGLFYESHLMEWSAGARPLATLLREPQMQGALAAAPAMAAADPATAQFINQQLASQEQGRVAWQGQLCPGQDLAWQISRDPPEPRQRQDGAEAPESPWRSALRLRFPELGEISATVVLAGNQVHIELQAGSEQIGSTLRARAGQLQRALEASGNPLTSLTVSLASAGKPGHD